MKITTQNDIDVVLDASGFYFGDQWGPHTTEKSAALFTKWKKKGKKIILLPQAFGPFSSDRLREAFNKLVENSDLIFARDKVSFQYSIDVVGKANQKVQLAPDFTNLLSAIAPSSAKEFCDRPCIIPNAKMMAKASPNAQKNYIPLLAKMIDFMMEKGLSPFILIHEIYDIQIAQEILKEVKTQIPIVQDKNPLHIKGIIGKSQFVVSSRFHGLVSSLSQEVPCLGTGWSHKYKELFTDYSCPDFLLSVEDDKQLAMDKLSTLICPSSRSKISGKIAKASQNQKMLSQGMWNKVKFEAKKL
ncbi:MAG: polysaccharide pyruvyl transferase family protein [Okeania sp. SIO2G5]|nr:polysaccharide pyruvyl transferase family protein [Okeania sp. SIO2G5]